MQQVAPVCSLEGCKRQKSLYNGVWWCESCDVVPSSGLARSMASRVFGRPGVALYERRRLEKYPKQEGPGS